MKQFIFTADAKPVNEDFAEVGVWTDGIGIFSDGGELCRFNLIEGKTYKVTVEEIGN